MPSEHVLTSRDKWFLERGMVDPITKAPFQVGDTIVICARCKTVHLDATWGMNPNRSCAICGENTAQVFPAFSQKLFQVRNVNKQGFRIKERPLPFYMRVQQKNLYPAAYSGTALLLALTVLVLFLNLRPVISSENWPARTESVLAQFSAEMESKCSRLLENCREITIESGRNLRTFPAHAAEKTGEIQEKVKKTRIPGKFHRMGDKLQAGWRNIQLRLATLWEAVQNWR